MSSDAIPASTTNQQSSHQLEHTHAHNNTNSQPGTPGPVYYREFPPLLTHLSPREAARYRYEHPFRSAIHGERILKNGHSNLVVAAKTTQGKSVVAKTGATANEANIQIFLYHQGLDFVPKVCGYYLVEDIHNVLVMELLPGQTLTYKSWKDFSKQSRRNFINSLASTLQRMRAIKTESIGGIFGGSVDWGRYVWQRPGDTEEELSDELEYLIRKCRKITAPIKDQYPDEVRQCAELIAQHIKRRRPVDFVFTHCDLYVENILVDASGYVTGLIDFSTAEFLPDYMEMAFAVTAPSPRWWKDVLLKVFQIVSPDYQEDDPALLIELLLTNLLEPDWSFLRGRTDVLGRSKTLRCNII